MLVHTAGQMMSKHRNKDFTNPEIQKPGHLNQESQTTLPTVFDILVPTNVVLSHGEPLSVQFTLPLACFTDPHSF